MDRKLAILMILLLFTLITSCKSGEEKGDELSSDLTNGTDRKSASDSFINPDSDFLTGDIVIDVPEDTPTVTTDMKPITLIDDDDDMPVVVASGGKHTLKIIAAGVCWLEVKGPGGKIFAGTLAEGDEKNLGPADYFLITLGKPKNAEVHFDGQHIYGGVKQVPSSLYIALPPEASVHLQKPEETIKVDVPKVIEIPTSGAYTLKIDITGECWVQVKSGGKTILERLLNEGDTRTLGPAEGFDIKIGKPKSAILTLNGKEVYGPNSKYPTSMYFKLPATYVPPDAPEQPDDEDENVLLGSPESPPIIIIEPVEPETIDTSTYDVWIENGQWMLSLDDPEAAIINFENAYDIAPNNTQVNMLLGKAHRENGNLDKSLYHLEKALALDSKDPDSLLEMGYTQEAKGNKEEAIKYFEKYLALRDIEEVREHLKELKNS